MSAPTQIRTVHRSSPFGRTPGTGPDTRLRWWALALPVAAFAALLILLSGPGAAGAHQPGAGSALVPLLEQLVRALP
ncbi:hypothetical protein [Streptomyces sp. NRRL S-87]|uniref:hypothetical protein n=1 Tax=Streptomyces sp. NRRL S-87 TaxID=1463920 RepID=UPI0004C1C573|nr:hypothetical protein [Streptomyces sp. NRRL S-87]